MNRDIEYFKGVDGIISVFDKTLKTKEKILRTVLKGKPLVYLAGSQFSDKYMNQRTEAKIFLKSLRFSSENLDLPKHKNYADFNKEIRIAPKNVKIDNSLIIFDDYVAIVDEKDISCTLIKNSQNAEIMKNWFDYIWENSN